MHYIYYMFDIVNKLTWGWSLVPLLVILGVFITILTNFVQFRFFTRMFKVLKGKNTEKNKISAREALIISVGGRVGGGNIAGIAGAIALGGPGAVFWMWAVACLGMATSLVESSLAQLYKRKQSNGLFRGGPARSIIHGLGKNFHWLAVIYAICLIGSFGLGFNAFQGNTVAGAMKESFHIPRLWSAIFLSLLAGCIIFGGIRRIAKVSDIIVPIMAFGYIIIALAVIIINYQKIPALLSEIFMNAFGIKEVVSGGMGIALAQGVRRGLFSNEAGLGSAPNVAATAEVKHPISQGITQSFSVFIDTMIVCSCTAFIILLSNFYTPGANIDGVILTQKSLAEHLGHWSEYLLAIMLLLFSFSTMIYNYYLGENALTVITKNKLAIILLRILIIGIIFIGSITSGATSIFFFADPLMGTLAIVNLVVIMMLLPTCLRILSDYRIQIKNGIKHPVFDPNKFTDLDIDKNAWIQK